MLSNFGNVAIAAAILAVVGGTAGYFFALSMADQGRKGMFANSATLAGVLVLVFGMFSLALALPMAVKLTIAGLIAWFGLALFLPSVLVAFDGEAQNRVVKTAEASAEALLICFNEISGGKDVIKEHDLHEALKTKGVYTSAEKRAMKDVLAHMEQAGHLVDTLRRKVLLPIPMSKVQVLPTVQVIEVYHITRDDLRNYAAKRLASW